jgi:hypothetical protein
LPPFPEPPLKLSDFNFDNFNDSEFDSEQVQWGGEEQFEGDAERAVILASFSAQRYRWVRQQVLGETNATNFEHAVQILRKRAAAEKAGCLLMAAERYRRTPQRSEARLAEKLRRCVRQAARSNDGEAGMANGGEGEERR